MKDRVDGEVVAILMLGALVVAAARRDRATAECRRDMVERNGWLRDQFASRWETRREFDDVCQRGKFDIEVD